MDALLQVRTNEADKQEAARILSELGTTTSAVVNMLLKQIIITKSIPFEIKLESTVGKKISAYRIDDIKAVLKHVTNSIEEIWVFGSTVTPYCRPQSDLDLCIIGHTTTEEESRIYKSTQCSVDIITATPKEFEKQCLIPGSVYKEVKDNGILIYKKGKKIEWMKMI